MKLQTKPSRRLIDKVLDRGWRRDKRYYVDSGDKIALLTTRAFFKIKYLGIATLQSHKLRRDKVYSFLTTESGYTGELLKDAMKILGKKRVGIFYHWRNKVDGYFVLILGTKEGSIAIAPRIGYSENMPYGAKEMESLKDYLKKPNSVLVRKFIFGRI